MTEVFTNAEKVWVDTPVSTVAPGANLLLDAALMYASHGIPVFPCLPHKKIPRTTNGFRDASKNETTIRNWWHQWPDANVAVPTGSTSGFIAVDPDAPKHNKDGVLTRDGRVTWAALVAERGWVIETQMSHTPRGGQHLLFKVPKDHPVRNSAGTLTDGANEAKDSGIDIRGDGGYIVVSPSIGDNGDGGLAQYTWDSPFDPANISEPPDGLLELITKPGEREHAAAPGEAKPPLAPNAEMSPWAAGALRNIVGAYRALKTGRNHHLNIAAMQLGELIAGGELNRAAVERALLEAAEFNGGVAAHTLKGIEATIRSGIKKGFTNPRSRPDISAAAAHGAEIAKAIGNVAGDDGTLPVEVPTYETIKRDIAGFRVEAMKRKDHGEPTYPEKLKPIINKVALLVFNGSLDEGQKATLVMLFLGSGVHGFSSGGTFKGTTTLKNMLDQAIAKLMTERKAARWQDQLMRGDDGSGAIIANEENAAIAVSNMYGNVIRYDKFRDEIKFGEPSSGSGTAMGQDEYFDVTRTVQRAAIPTIRPLQVRAAVTRVARVNQFDSLQDYLLNLQWDGTSRDGWMHLLTGAPDTQYYRQIERWWTIGTAARALQPGCQMDNMLVFVSKQGKGKNKALRILSGDRVVEYTDDFATKDGQQKMRGHWFIEMSEMSSLSRRDNLAYKAFQTRLSDKYRKAFDVDFVEYPRQFVTVGTANPEPFLRDPTGERRYWVVDLGENVDGIRHDALARNVDQIWAEAVTRIRTGEKWWPAPGATDQWFLDEQVKVNERWSQMDAWELVLRGRLLEGGIHTPGCAEGWPNESWPGGSATQKPYRKVRGAAWILSKLLERPIGQFTQTDSNRVAAIMKRLGYKNQSVRLDGTKAQGYMWVGNGTAGEWWLRLDHDESEE
ncbi:VapE family protein [Bradyrhizobium sp. LjRoot220]|uniref:VapE domain-containing protein n=1 Tax=Bradyrhizobium sp. LjRoot220 TaxID=3342284 RepID=UPI003ED0E0B6